MFKQAFRSYVASLHPENLKKVKAENLSWFGPLYWLMIYPAIMGRNSNDFDLPWGVYLLYLAVKMLPLCLMFWSNMVCRMPMPKMMYLTPIGKENRYQYIKSLIFIKIGAPALLSFILQIIWVCFFDMSVIQMAVIIFLYISIGIGSYVCSDLVNKYDRRITMAVQDKSGEPKDAWLNIAVEVLGMLMLMALESSDFMHGITDLDGTALGVIVFTILMVLLMIGDIVILKTRYKDTLENLCDYEATQRMIVRKEKNG